MAALGTAGTLVLAGAALCLATGCSQFGYLAQSVGGHLDLMSRARPVPQWLADGTTPAALRERLALTQRMRDFAVHELRLPDNGSYRSYADLGRSAAVWNVVAAPELSLQLMTSCFPVVGCVGYRGYYQLAEAQRVARELQQQGWEVSVYGVPAYSTLGWVNWLGGDPLLNTFLDQPEGEIARLIFHELAHQVAYARDDTPFNESFATAVERLGGERWLRTQADEAARRQDAVYDARRRDFRDLTLRTRRKLDDLYRSDASDADKRAGKARIMADMRAEYAALKAGRWNGWGGYDAWVARANNAALSVQGAYADLVPAFERLFAAEGSDFTRFYAEVRRLAALPKPARDAALNPDRRPPCPTSPSAASTPSACPRRASSPGRGPRRWRRSTAWRARCSRASSATPCSSRAAA
jgi:predicted aminopeptidase